MGLGAVTDTVEQYQQQAQQIYAEEVAPRRAAVEAEIQKYKGYADKASRAYNFVKDPTPEKAAAWAKEGLVQYAQENGYPITGDVQKDIENIARGYGEQQLAAQGIPITLRYKNLSDAATNIAAAGACYALQSTTGFNPQMASVTFEALKDGKVSAEEAKSIGSMAGAIAGAAACQAFGIPAPIGAWIGGFIGGTIGGAISDIFGLGSDREKQAREHQKALERQATEARLTALGQCNQMRATYWRTYDDVVYSLEEQWQLLECRPEIRSRFALRWFGNTPSDIFGTWKTMTLAVQEGTRSVEKWELIRSTGRYERYMAQVPIWVCKNRGGCPYPTLMRGGTSTPLPRVQSALLSLGVPVLQCTDRKVCSIPPWNGQGSDEGLRNYIDSLSFARFGSDKESGGGSYGPNFHGLDAARVQITGDLSRTASAVASEIKIATQKADLKKRGLAAAFSDQQLRQFIEINAASERGRTLSAYVNYGALGLGAVVLGMALARRERG